jgi:uncharacterized protein (DUF433 family)
MSKRTKRSELAYWRIRIIVESDRLGLTPAEIAKDIGIDEERVNIILNFYKRHGAEAKDEPKND